MKERDIFVAALAITDPDERNAFLTEACVDVAQKEHLQAMLVAEPGLGTFLESPAHSLEPTGLAEGPGAVVGSYKLLEQIGEGGMGVVFMAEQTRTVRRRVALKVIKPGMDSRQVIARFEAERQALALMEHPNIARVLDAGATESGRPYFVMELVSGVPITEYCDKHRLTTGQRLRLFITVCLAIQHAHQKGVIHRDIKPSNVMVTAHDGEPTAKVIDFGIAKAIDQRLTERTLFTTLGQLIGTPAYMSPEQAEMANVDVDTRTDIYSLGVLLYELMTGSTPIDSTRLQSAGLGEIQRLICDETPPRPSARLSTLSDAATVLAENRSTDPKHLARFLAGDLDWIMMKALEKDRNRRYATAGEFAADVERFLRGEAVVARPPSVAYRLSRFVRRNRGAVTAFVVATLTLLAGTTVATWQAIVANREKRNAELATKAQRAATFTAQAREAETQTVLDFVQDRIFAAPRPLDQAMGLGKDVSLEGALVAALPYVEQNFAKQPLVEARVRNTLGKSFLYLGKAPIAAEQIGRAHEIYLRLLGPADARTLESANGVANSLRDLGKLEEARKTCEQTFDRCKSLFGKDDLLTLETMNTLAAIYGDLGRDREALDLREQTLAARRAKLGPKHFDTMKSMMNLASSYAAHGRVKDALKLDEEALAIAKETLTAEHPDSLIIRNNLAIDYADVHRYEDALALQRETLKILKIKLGADHPVTLVSMHNVAKALSDLKRHEEAATVLDAVFAFQRIKPGPDHPETLHTMYSLGNQMGYLDRYADAVKWHQQALDGRKAKLGPDNLQTLYSMWGVAVNLLKLNRGSEALPIIDECLERATAHHVADFSGLANRRLEYFEKAGDAEGCRSTAELWEKLRRTDAASCYNAARYRAVTAAVLRENDQTPDGIRQDDDESDRALKWLHQAVAAGFKDKDELVKCKDFDAVRARAEFRKLIAELEAAPK
jgi:serine/threonine protein kinase/tetratricopeptide (TPR) repeat protein